MEAMRKSWTDERLDHFAEGVDRRFDVVDRRFDEVDRRFDEVDRRFDDFERRFDKIDVELHRVNDRLDGMGRAMIYAAFSITISVLAGYAAMITLVVTRT
jgi:hypothetical protein